MAFVSFPVILFNILIQICITGILCTLTRLVLININPINPFQKLVQQPKERPGSLHAHQKFLV